MTEKQKKEEKDGRGIEDWDQFYRDTEIEAMPWFHDAIDPDLEEALDSLGITGGNALDVGTGPGTQAIAMAERGLSVTATDLSESAVKKAHLRATDAGVEIDFRVDNILSSTVGEFYDLLFDRGCFHTLDPESRQEYVGRVAALLAPKGYLFLKCFSHLETMEEGPFRFAPEEIRGYFDKEFEVVSIKETVYHGTLDPLPKALFCVLRRR
jgi:cyclopropane fatty-acyl-phospholipid synthase-like methyltransferase